MKGGGSISSIEITHHNYFTLRLNEQCTCRNTMMTARTATGEDLHLPSD